MKVGKAQSIIHQHQKANESLNQRRLALAEAEATVKELGIEGIKTEETIKRLSDEQVENAKYLKMYEEAVVAKRQEMADLDKNIARLRQQLSQEPIELRAARQMVVQCKERIAAKQREVDKWGKELPEAQAVVTEYENAIRLKQIAHDQVMKQAESNAVEDLKKQQAEGKIPAHVDVTALAKSYFDQHRRKPHSVIVQQFQAR